jgi:hypothetical protein
VHVLESGRGVDDLGAATRISSASSTLSQATSAAAARASSRRRVSSERRNRMYGLRSGDKNACSHSTRAQLASFAERREYALLPGALALVRALPSALGRVESFGAPATGFCVRAGQRRSASAATSRLKCMKAESRRSNGALDVVRVSDRGCQPEPVVTRTSGRQRQQAAAGRGCPISSARPDHGSDGVPVGASTYRRSKAVVARPLCAPPWRPGPP